MADRADVLRAVTFYMGLALILCKFGVLQEIQTYTMHFKLYLLYIFGIPAILGVIVAGGIRRGLAARTAYYWVGFSIWLLVCVPFSSWRARSFMMARNFIRDDLLMLFVIAGLVVSWRECRMAIKVIALAAVTTVMASNIFSVEGGEADRLSMGFGTIGNSNDLAAHLLLILPFLLLFVYQSRWFVIRIGALAVLSYGILVIFRTASRGALLALIADALFVFWRGSSRQRIAVLCLIPVTIAGVLTLVPSSTLQRIVSFSASERDVSSEALESSAVRHYLLTKAIEYAIEFPLFGVGPGNFTNYEGAHGNRLGAHGMYHDPHNSYIQAFTEAGVLGGSLMLAGYISAFLLLSRVHRKAKLRPECRDIQQTAFCIMLGMVGFSVAIFFLNFVYFYYGPALSGLAICVWRAAEYEFTIRTPQPVPSSLVAVRA